MDELQNSQLKGFYSRFFLCLLLVFRKKNKSNHLIRHSFRSTSFHQFRNKSKKKESLNTLTLCYEKHFLGFRVDTKAELAGVLGQPVSSWSSFTLMFAAELSSSSALKAHWKKGFYEGEAPSMDCQWQQDLFCSAETQAWRNPFARGYRVESTVGCTEPSNFMMAFIWAVLKSKWL